MLKIPYDYDNINIPVRVTSSSQKFGTISAIICLTGHNFHKPVNIDILMAYLICYHIRYWYWFVISYLLKSLNLLISANNHYQ